MDNTVVPRTQSESPSSARPTHAGGVVYRRTGAGDLEFLVVTAKIAREDWVWPKGHIERGERAEEAAVREVAEEAGVRARPVRRLADVERVVKSTPQRIRFFVMEATGVVAADEGRDVAWLSPAAAQARLTYPDAKALVSQAVAALEAGPESR